MSLTQQLKAKNIQVQKVEAGYYLVYRDGKQVADIVREYQRATGDTRYIGHVPGRYRWDLCDDERRLFDGDTLADVKQYLANRY